MTTAIGGVPQASDVKGRGGGDLSLIAGRDLKGGVFHLGQGQAEIVVGGKLTYGDTLVAQRNTRAGNSFAYTPRTLAALFGPADATLSISARNGAEHIGRASYREQVCANR